MTDKYPNDNTTDRKPDTKLTGFLSYLRAERNASEHTLESYRMDIEQFSKLILNQDAAGSEINWDDVSVHDARSFVVGLQGEELTKSDAHAQLSISRDSAMLEVIYSGGLRISEATGLNLGSVDLIGGVMLVRGKGKKERICALGGPANRALRSYLKVRAVWNPDTRKESPLFVNQDGDRITPRSFQRNFKLYLEQAGLPADMPATASQGKSPVPP